MNFTPLSILFPILNMPSIGGFIIEIIFVLFIIYIKRNSYKYESNNFVEVIEKGKFSKYARLSQKNLMKASICLSILMLFKDKIDFPEKLKYIKKYFYKKFPSTYEYFPDAFSSYLKSPVTIESVCYWLNKKLSNKQDRINILYFIAGISMIDGSLSNSEHQLLIQIQQLLNLEKKDLDSIIAMYTRYEETKEEQRINSFQSNTDRRDQARIVIYCTVLEISEKSTFEEIKKAHRKLAMLNHPDKYEKAGKDMMNLANERFLKIQEAYEFLERMNKLKKIN